MAAKSDENRQATETHNTKKYTLGYNY